MCDKLLKPIDYAVFEGYYIDTENGNGSKTANKFINYNNKQGGSSMNMNRVKELVATMESFGKEKYKKSELLNEMFALQKEIVGLTFNGDHASTADLKIWDVERHLDQLNQDCGNVADEELQRFKDGSKILCNLIKAEISGNRGEAKAFRTLQYIHSKNTILKNVELSDGDFRTELDAVVITPGAVTIIEVKNTAKNIFIDENGDYFRTGEFLKWDCNIAEKMTLKEELLRKVLAADGMDGIRIRSIVVFTENRIEVHSKYSKVRTCFVSQLAYIIDGFKSDKPITDEEMEQIESAIRTAESNETYPFDFDVARYKLDFATVMAILEEASAKEEAEYEEKVVAEHKNGARDALKKFFTSKYAGYAGSAVAAAAITFVSMAAVSAVRKGGFR